MADRFRHVSAGDPLDIPAGVYNEMLDALVWIRAQQAGDSASSPAQPVKAGMVWVRNDSGRDRPPGSVLGISGAISVPANQVDAQVNMALVGVFPVVAAHLGRFVVTAEPIRQGLIGRAWAFGVFPCQIQVQAAGDAYADVPNLQPPPPPPPGGGECWDDSLCYLTSAPQGAARILWTSGSTGQVWAIVRMVDNRAVFPVLVKQNGGADGSVTSYCHLSYDIFAQNDTGLTSKINVGDPQEPAIDTARIIPGSVHPAADGSTGLAWLGADGNPQLVICEEWLNDLVEVSEDAGVPIQVMTKLLDITNKHPTVSNDTRKDFTLTAGVNSVTMEWNGVDVTGYNVQANGMREIHFDGQYLDTSQGTIPVHFNVEQASAPAGGGAAPCTANITALVLKSDLPVLGGSAWINVGNGIVSHNPPQNIGVVDVLSDVITGANVANGQLVLQHAKFQKDGCGHIYGDAQNLAQTTVDLGFPVYTGEGPWITVNGSVIAHGGPGSPTTSIPLKDQAGNNIILKFDSLGHLVGMYYGS